MKCIHTTQYLREQFFGRTFSVIWRTWVKVEVSLQDFLNNHLRHQARNLPTKRFPYLTFSLFKLEIDIKNLNFYFNLSKFLLYFLKTRFNFSLVWLKRAPCLIGRLTDLRKLFLVELLCAFSPWDLTFEKFEKIKLKSAMYIVHRFTLVAYKAMY